MTSGFSSRTGLFQSWISLFLRRCRQGTICHGLMLSCVNNAGKRRNCITRQRKVVRPTTGKHLPKLERSWGRIFVRLVQSTRPTFLRAHWRMTPNYFGLMWKIFAKNTRGLLISNLRIILWVIIKPRQIYWTSSFQVFSQKKDQGRFHNLALPTLPLRTWSSRLKVLKLKLQKLDPSKSQGPDNLPPWFLKMIVADLVLIFRDLFQASVDTGQVPEQWKTANITALFTKGNRAEASNYRPVSLTVVACKILEHIIHSHVMKHLEKHHILTDQQHTFRAKRSRLNLTMISLVNSTLRRKLTLQYLIFRKRWTKCHIVDWVTN